MHPPPRLLPCRLAAGLALVALAAAMPAQATTRRPLVGRVQDVAGHAIPGAAVTLFWSPPGGDEVGPTDVVQATGDERGFFRALLLVGESYSAFAATGQGADGRFRCSRMHEDVAVGREAVFELGPACAPQRVQVHGLQAWSGAGPLLLEAVPAAANVLRLSIGADGAVPPMPSLGQMLVVTARGEVLAALDGGRQALVEGILPPWSAVVHADDVAGLPVAGTNVLVAAGEFTPAPGLMPRSPRVWWRSLGATDAHGDLAIALPVSRGQGGVPSGAVLLDLTANGRQAATHPFLFAGRLLTEQQPKLSAVLEPAAVLQLEGDHAEVGERDLTLLAVATAERRVGRGCRLRTDGVGRCTVAVPSAPIETVLHWRTEAGARAWLRVPLRSGETTALPTDALRRVQLDVVDASGAPAAGVPFLLVSDTGHLALKPLDPHCTDHRGRLDLLLGGDPWLLAFGDGVAGAWYEVPAGGAEVHARVELAPWPQMTLRCRDDAGGPVVGLQATLSPQAPQLLPDVADRLSKQLRLDLAHELDAGLAARHVSDRDGVLRLPFVPQPMPQLLLMPMCAPNPGELRVVAIDVQVRTRG